MTTYSIVKSGLNANLLRQATSSHNLANTSTDGFSKQRVTQHERANGGTSTQVDTVTLSKEAQNISDNVPGPQNNVNPAMEVVSQVASEQNFKQNAKMVKTQDNMHQTLLDTLA